jgi:guanylate kinase
LLVVSAPSGTGKTTLCDRLLLRRPELRISISTTTRPPRGDEVDGEDYDFVSVEAFKRCIAEDAFVEWAEVHGKYYGTRKARIEELLGAGVDVLLDVDVQGAESLKEVFGDTAVTLMLLPPSLEELERRLRGRGTDDEGTIQVRLGNSRSELARWATFDEVVVNDDLDLALEDLEAVLEGRPPPHTDGVVVTRKLFGAAP